MFDAGAFLLGRHLPLSAVEVGAVEGLMCVLALHGQGATRRGCKPPVASFRRVPKTFPTFDIDATVPKSKAAAVGVRAGDEAVSNHASRLVKVQSAGVSQ